MRVALDTNILIWATRSDLDPVDDNGRDIADLQRRSRILLKELAMKAVEIVVPEIAISEYLCGIPRESQNEVTAVFHERFFCQPFDARSSAYTGQLFLLSHGLDEFRKTRRLLKADTMIVASAKSAICSVFYSNDERCRRLATMMNMIAKDLPTHSPDLLTNLEVKQEFPPNQLALPSEEDGSRFELK